MMHLLLIIIELS